MGLFDKLLGRNNDHQNPPSADMIRIDRSKTPSDPSSIEKAIAERYSGISLDKCIRIPFGDVAALGTAFSQILPSLRTISVEGIGYIPVNMEQGTVLKMAKDGTNWGAYVSKSGTSKFVKWVKAGPASAQLPINPGMIMMAAMLANIGKKLDSIQETQQKILSFLDLDKQAGQQADLNLLTEIQNGYEQNWDNDLYLHNNHMKVLDIKQSSEKNIIFYQEQIASVIKKLPALHVDQNVKNTIVDLGRLFGNYRMALYLFSFSSYLEVMLLGNFRQEYLDRTADKVREYNEHYQKQCKQCGDFIKTFSEGSLETKVIAGIGNVSKALGSLIASSPVLSKGPVDEWLLDSGDRMLKGTDDKVSEAVALFISDTEIGSDAFVDSIRTVGTISNHTTEILFDKDAIYLYTA